MAPVAENRKKQTRLDFTAASSSSAPNSSDKRSTRSKPHHRQGKIDFTRARHRDTFSSPIRLASSPSSARPQSSGRAGMFGDGQSTLAYLSSEDELERELPSPKDLVAKRRSTRMRKEEEAAQVTVDLSSEDGDDIVVSRKPHQMINIDSEDEDTDQMPTTAGTQRRKRKLCESPDSFIASSPPLTIESSEDDGVDVQAHRSRHRRQQSVESEGEVEGSDTQEPSTPKRRRLAPRRQLSHKEQQELDEDLDFLGPSSDVERSARKARNTRDAKKDTRQRALEKLKRRRSGQIAAATEGHDEADEASGTDDDDGSLSVEEQAPAIRSSQMFREDEDDENFIDSDDEEENTLGIPDGLPLEYTRYASMKAKELFKYAVEWFVQKKFNPAFQMNDPIYELTFRKLDDEVTGLAGSKFRSSAWTSQFTVSLNSRPDIAIVEIDRSDPEHFMRTSCDACNRSNHPATYQIQFQGKPYHRDTLEEVAGNDEDDEDGDSSSDTDIDEPSYDASGREVPPISRVYYVGKFCMSNARTAHSLQHWRYHLNGWITSWLDKSGYNTQEEIVKRDGWNTKKRRKHANKVADHLEEIGIVKQLYHDYKSNIDDARDSKQGRYAAWQ